MNDIYWIKNDGEARLAIVARPRGDDWLEDEMRRMKENGIDTVVSLLEPLESLWLGLGEEERAAQRAGLEFLSYPIKDTQVPVNVGKFRQFITGLWERLAHGEAVGVHCRGCIGRATVTAACALIHLGWEPKRALEAIERARGTRVPDTPEQEAWILDYEAEP
ncbi:MAG TPA: hypothetical protein VKB38_11970 [Terracidiphilus sp.]|nr:hypothetical protein [Terracidiphilus sp.]